MTAVLGSGTAVASILNICASAKLCVPQLAPPSSERTFSFPIAQPSLDDSLSDAVMAQL